MVFVQKHTPKPTFSYSLLPRASPSVTNISPLWGFGSADVSIAKQVY
jgi:hypothetical protein